MKRSFEQLCSQVWPTRAAAVKDLKRDGLPPRGADYELVETGYQSWQIRALEDVTVEPPPASPAKTKAKPAKATKTVAKDPAPPTAEPEPAPEPEPEPVGSGLFDAAVEPTPDAWARATKAARASKTAKPVAKAPEPEPERGAIHGHFGAQSVAPAPEPIVIAETPPQPAPGTDTRPIASDLGPFTLVISGDGLRQNNIVFQAVEVAQYVRSRVTILGPDGTALRMIDAQAIRAARLAVKGTAKSNTPAKSASSTRVAGSRERGGSPNPMIARAIEMARRPEGVTREQLLDVSPKQQPWTAIIKAAAEKHGYVYRTSEATSGRSRTVYHLDDKSD